MVYAVRGPLGTGGKTECLAHAVNWVRVNVIADLVKWYSEHISEKYVDNQDDLQDLIDERSFHAALEWIEEV